ncbi:hypothetical protein BCR33DRAFT_40242 [Rhizoclosmatium globosum]|uniref:RRN7-type domain-containing protein n=1 Tax=Rhizoclosmatium globosum TaxID=329046 RepID=A0A1Y2CNK9_9FUNG|nr:hypothetical protein BCR33DRAFT_40242 [Rhizoclosmatium globosum]|eukprot:ORY48619.1 hypothetical protein BCR33DRAFT_40242 [Rhizoclosmatium globosum]
MAKCPICRSTKFRRDGGTGLRFCSNGHQQRTARQIEVGDDDAMVGGLRLRRLKRGRRTKKVVFAKGFRAATSLFLFETFQLILKAQVLALVESEASFPRELETIVRDLWLMYVSHQGITGTKGMKEKAAKKRKAAQEAGETDSTPILKFVLASVYQLSFLYLGCLQLRLPVLLADVLQWADTSRIPYLNALDTLPDDYFSFVSRQALAFKLFQKKNVPTMELIRKRTMTLMNIFESMGVTFPEMNTPLILVRLVKKFRVPPELYVCAEIVRMVMGYVEGGFVKSSSNHKIRPEVLLIACLIVSIKICYSMEMPERNVFISWISNLPTLGSLIESMKLQIHKDKAEAMNKRTYEELDSQFQGYVNEFAVYCRDYLFDKPRLNAHRYGFQKVVEGLSHRNLLLHYLSRKLGHFNIPSLHIQTTPPSNSPPCFRTLHLLQ